MKRNHFNKAEQYKKEKIKAKRVRRIKRINLERSLAEQYSDQLTGLETISTKFAMRLDDEMLKVDIKKYPNDGD